MTIKFSVIRDFELGRLHKSAIRHMAEKRGRLVLPREQHKFPAIIQPRRAHQTFFMSRESIWATISIVLLMVSVSVAGYLVLGTP